MEIRLYKYITVVLILFLVACAQVPEVGRTAIHVYPTSTSNVPPTILATSTTGLRVIKTLSTKNAIAKTKQLIADNGGCELPCIWGIIPGKTTFEETKKLLVPLGEIAGQFSAFDIPNGGTDLTYPIDGSYLHVGVWYINNPANSAQDQIVYSVDYYLDAFTDISVPNNPGIKPIYNSLTVASEVEFYSLQQVLQRLGKPEEVLIETISQYAPVIEGTEQPSTMTMVLLYPSKGVMGRYITTVRIENGWVTGCFISPEILFKLYEPKVRTSESFIAKLGPQWEDQLSYFLPIEKATNFSTESFYNYFAGTSDGCMKTPSGLWPSPN